MDAIIRIGSAGGLPDQVNVRDVVIAEAASSNSAYGDGYGLSGSLAACANFEMLETAVAAARNKNISFHVGKVFTSDFFYYPQAVLNDKLKELGHLCVEMETAGLYWTAAGCGKRALSVLSISDHLYKPIALTAEERQNSFTDMMEIALETAWNIIQ